MTRPSATRARPRRGEIWRIRFDPTRGAEMGKTRPAVKESAADCFQVKSVSLTRFVSRLGELRADEIEEISAAIALCVGA
ncbi:MAG: type II toxin-antitoxin system PemK/MazF family toxin [bacterium]|nr:type II toxin-antitoxin system PemK/MazF family toxin [bacterium]